MIKKISIALLMMLCFFSQLLAQSARLLTTENDLSSSLITDIAKDKDSMVWIATENGLNRFDGNKTICYFHQRGNSHSLSSNRINSLYIDSKGRLFVCTKMGVQIYRPDTDDFSYPPLNKQTGKYDLQDNITSIVELSDGRLLASGNRLFEIRVKADSLFVDAAQFLGDSKGIGKMRADCNDNIWLCRRYGGIICYNNKYNSSYSYFSSGDVGIMPSSICTTPNGKVYIGTQKNGVYMYEPEQDSFVNLTPDFKSLVRIIYTENDKEVYIGTDGDGLKLYNTQTKQLTGIDLGNVMLNTEKLKIHALLKEANGTLWLGIYQKGVLVLPRQNYRFEYLGPKSFSNNVIGSNAITAIEQDKDGDFWIGTDNDGIYHLTSTNQNIRHFYQEGIPSIVTSLFEDSKHRLWFGSYEQGMGWIDKSTGKCSRLKLDRDIDEESGSVYSFTEDRWHQLWIATLGQGIYIYNLDNQKLKSDSLLNSRVNRWINSLHYCPKNDSVYVATYNGMYSIHAQTLQTNVILRNGIVYAIYHDVEGNLWMGTSNGLMVRKAGRQEVENIDITSGKWNNQVYSIQGDRKGNLWIGTNRGLVHMNPTTFETSYFYTSDGLQGNEFCLNASLIDRMGRLWFGGTDGITYFVPDSINQIRRDFHIRLCDFYIYDKRIHKGMRSGNFEVMKQTVYNNHDFHLCHSDNSFGFEFATIDFGLASEHITFSYCINGGKWINLMRGVNKLSFNNLPSGVYHIRVRAECYKTLSNELDYTITIHTSPWNSWWAWTLYCLVLIIGIVLLAMEARSRYRAKQELKRYLQEEQENEAKLQFLINISHEIRTPMSLIISPLQKLMNNDDDPDMRKNNYWLMQKNSQRILTLINQLLDVRKIEKGQMRLLFKQVRLVPFIESVCDYFTQFSIRRNLTLHFIHPYTDQLELWIDPSYFDKILFNLLSNAFKFTPDGGEVCVTLEQTETDAVLTVSDTGIGLSQTDKEKLFERFYQSKSVLTKSSIGSGIGLHLTHSLVMLHHGTITADNNGGGKSGCHFTITIPLGRAHLSDEEIIQSEQPTEIANKPMTETVECSYQIIHSESDETATIAKSNIKHHILIVEDDEEINEYLRKELSLDFHTDSCSNGVEALEMLHKHTFDLVVSDIMMPKMDGIELCKSIKRHLQFNHIPVILLTAKTCVEDNLQGLHVGADAYITKPFNLDVLRSNIYNMIQNRQTLRNAFSGQQNQVEMIEKPQLQSPDEKLMERIVRVINENLSNPNISVSDIAKEVGISSVHLNRKLRELTNQTTSRFIRNLRLQAAAQMLKEKKHSIAEVSDLTGFSDPSYFSKSFKEFYGMYPSVYMKQNITTM